MLLKSITLLFLSNLILLGNFTVAHTHKHEHNHTPKKPAKNSLTSTLEKRRTKAENKRPVATKKAYEKGSQEIRKLSLDKKRPNVGDAFPDWTLSSSDKKNLKISDVWKQGYAIVKFYRGHWCPYCQLELKAYQEKLQEFNKYNAGIIVFTPDTQRFIDKTKKRFKIKFPIYTDKENTFAKKLGIVFKLNEEVNSIYKKFDINLIESQDNNKNELPLPATYVINKLGKVIYKFADSDYTLRADPVDILNFLSKHQ